MHTIMIAEALLKFNANPNIPFPENGMTPLHVAAMYGHAQIAQLILMVSSRHAVRPHRPSPWLTLSFDCASRAVQGGNDDSRRQRPYCSGRVLRVWQQGGGRTDLELGEDRHAFRCGTRVMCAAVSDGRGAHTNTRLYTVQG